MSADTLPPLVEPADELTVDEVRRYSRHLIIPDVGMTGQKRLKNAKVLVVGAGGLGSPALLYLAAAGVGTLGIVDFDDGRRVQPAAPDHPRPVRHRPAQGGVAPRSRSRRSTRYVNVVLHEERLDSTNVVRDLPAVRPHRRRHRQLRDALPGQRRGRAARQAVRLGLDLPLRRPGVRLLGRARPVLPLPLPRAAAARHGAVLRRGRRARRAVRVDRLDPGQRGDQAAHRHRRPAGRPADGLRRPRDDLPQGQGPQGPRVRGLRQEPGDHPRDRAHRLRGVLRHDQRGGRRGGQGLDDHGRATSRR